MSRASRSLPTFDDFVRVRAEVQAVDDRLVRLIPVSDIRPSSRNPRGGLPALDELSASIQQHGLLQPVVVRPVADGYELIAGHRRLAAVLSLGWTTIPALVREEDDDHAYVLTLVENLQREDLRPEEEAAALEVLVRHLGWSTRQVAEAIKRSPMYVSRRLRVFDDPVLGPLVLASGVPVSTGEELLRVNDTGQRAVLAEQAAREGWTQMDARAAVAAHRSGTLHESKGPIEHDAAAVERHSLGAATEPYSTDRLAYLLGRARRLLERTRDEDITPRAWSEIRLFIDTVERRSAKDA